MGTLTAVGRHRSVSLTWGRSVGEPVTVAGMPATMPDMPPPTPTGKMTFEERARTAGLASVAAQTPEERSELGRAGAAAAHSLVNLARRVAAKWDGATDDERAEVRRILRAAGVIR